MPSYFSLPVEDVFVSNIGLSGAATVWEALDDDVGANDGDTTRASRGGTTLNGDFRCRMAPLPALASVQALIIRYAARQDGPTGSVPCEMTPYLYIEGVEYLGATIQPGDSGFVDEFFRWDVNPATLEPWTKGTVEGALIGFKLPRDEGELDNIQHLTYMYREVLGVPAEVGKERDIASVYLTTVSRRPIEFDIVTRGIEVLDNNLVEDITLQHVEHPMSKILGRLDNNDVLRTGKEGWRGVLMENREFRIDLNSQTVEVTLRRRRGNLFTLYDGGESLVSASAIENGVARFAVGDFRYTRDGRAYNFDPATDRVVPFESGERPIARNGFTPENFARNWVVNSSAKFDLTGVTDVGGSSGTLTRETDPPNALFRSDASGACFLFTAGSPHTNANAREWVATLPEKDLLLRFSVDHLDDGVFDWQIARDDTGESWDDDAAAWTGSSVWNSFPLRDTETTRDSSKVIPGGDPTTLYVRLRQPSGGTPGRLNRAYHLQLEDNGLGLVTSQIVTVDGSQSRGVQLWGASNDDGRRSFPNSFGTIFVKLIPYWNSSQVSIGFPPVMVLDHDVDNAWLFFINGPAGNRVDFVSKFSGVQTQATSPFTAVFNEPVVFAARWIPIDEETYGLPAGTMSIFVNGVKGTDGIRTNNPLEAGESDVYLGTSPSGVAFNGVVKRFAIKPELFTDEEILKMSLLENW